MTNPRVVRSVLAGLAVALTLAGTARADDEKPLYLEDESLVLGADLVRVTRPNEEWVFLDLTVQKETLMRTRPAHEVEASFNGLLGRLHHPGLDATLSVYVFDAAPEQDLAAREGEVRAWLKETEAKVKRAGRTRLAGRIVAQHDYHVEGADGAGTWFVTRLDAVHEGKRRLLAFVFEVPKEKRRAAAGDLKTIWKKVRF